MTEQERKDYEAHKSGTMKLQPFYENAMDDMSAGFFTRLTGDVPASYKGIGTFANVRTTLSKLMFDNDSTTFYTSGVAQKEGDWTGADLGRVRDVEEVRILQGRNSVDDVDYFDHAVVEYSEDGKTWTPLTGELEKQYVINWSGEPVRARYVRLKRARFSPDQLGVGPLVRGQSGPRGAARIRNRGRGCRTGALCLRPQPRHVVRKPGRAEVRHSGGHEAVHAAAEAPGRRQGHRQPAGGRRFGGDPDDGRQAVRSHGCSGSGSRNSTRRSGRDL